MPEYNMQGFFGNDLKAYQPGLANTGIGTESSANTNADFFNPGAYDKGWNFNDSSSIGDMNLELVNKPKNFIGSSDSLALGTKPKTGFDWEGSLNNFALGAQGITGLAGAYNAWQQTRLQKEQLALQKGFANRNLGNQAILSNDASLARASVAAQLYGNPTGSEGYYAKRDEIYNNSKVDGSPIGS